MVQNDVNGLLVPPNDAQALATALGHLLDEPLLRWRLADQGWRTIVEQFELERNVRAVYDVFMRQAGPTWQHHPVTGDGPYAGV
jgi:glycosyltransferase involved in cell wall biosynthesis